MKKFLTGLYLAASLFLTPLNAETIVLDPGHDREYYSGAKKAGYTEVEANLKFSSRLKRILEDSDFKVVETYTEKGYNSDVLKKEKEYRKLKEFKAMSRYWRLLYSRARFFGPNEKPNRDKYDVDLYLSLHVDYNDSKKENGFTLYVPYSSNIESKKFAKILRQKLENAGYNGWSNGSIKEAGFIVIEHSPGNIPRLLFERGFITNSADRKNLFENEEWNERMAIAVKDAIKEYFKIHKQ